jgi:transcriptional regulator with GAF, ATPase, and Fis domain
MAVRERLQIVELTGAAPTPPPGVEPFLCVLGTPPGGIDHLARARAVRDAVRETPVVVLGDLETEAIVRLMRLGVEDVVSTQLPPADAAARSFEFVRVPHRAQTSNELIGTSPAMQKLRRAIESLAATQCTVLLTGETGTGKGHVAREIHRRSDRRTRPFVHVDCASLSPTVIESELFGHEKGAFTGAVVRHTGRFELASGGTLFLDEVGNLGADLQAKLLRVLQEREYERIGGTKTLAMTARVIAATNADLRLAVRQGVFRADLYYRLNVFHLMVPPLRDRHDDVAALVHASLGAIAVRLGVRPPRPTDDFLARLGAHSWPGNVRELLNVLERIAMQYQGEELSGAHLDDVLEQPDAGEGPGAAFGEAADVPVVPQGARPSKFLTREQIAATLVATGGNVARTARRLGIPRSSLRYLVRKFDLARLIPAD